MKEPIFLEPVFKDYIWGGKRLKKDMKKETPYENTAESWEVSTNENGKNRIKNGEFEGKTLYALFENKKERINIFGTKTENMFKFPILVKFIDAASPLSVQVHPNNEYARKIENSEGKTEAWYIMDCSADAKIICGMKNTVKKEELSNIINGNKVEQNLNFLKIKVGDIIYIPSGTVHAILGDTLICEIQQNSDLTYRVYDWNRTGKDGKPRELHKEKAIDVIQLENEAFPKNTNTEKEGEYSLVSCEYFKINKIIVKEEYKEKSNINSFYIYNVVNGNGKLIVDKQEYDLKVGDSFIVPANLGEYKIQGKIELLKSYI